LPLSPFPSVILSLSQILVKAGIDDAKAFPATLSLYQTQGSVCPGNSQVAVSGNGFGLLVENLLIIDSLGFALA